MTSITIERSKSLYFPTGDIVLLSLAKDDVVTAFKVDSVFLIRSSPVFEGMFMLPPGDVESYDNIPLVKLQDEPDHLTMFLKGLYDSRCIPWKKHNYDTIKLVEGTLILATKYQIDHLRERIIGLLEQDWPSGLTQWDVNEAEIRAKRDSLPWGCDIKVPDPCEAISLARRCDVPSILPAVFYHLSHTQELSDRRILKSLQDHVLSSVDNHVARSADFSRLSVQDFHCLVVGRDAVLHLFNKLLNDAYDEIMKKKKKRNSFQACRKCLDEIAENFRRTVFQEFGDPLSAMKEDNSHPNANVCWHCRMIFHGLLQNKRKELWETLPTLFMLDTKE